MTSCGRPNVQYCHSATTNSLKSIWLLPSASKIAKTRLAKRFRWPADGRKVRSDRPADGPKVRQIGQQYGQIGQNIGQKYAQMGQDTGQYYRDKYAGGGGGHSGNTKSSGDTVINNGKYKKACKVNGGNFQDAVSWQATVNGEIIKSYCPWVWQNANRKKHCKQKQNNVLVSTACPCACAGY